MPPAKKTHCKNGHLRIPENLTYSNCRICAVERNARTRRLEGVYRDCPSCGNKISYIDKYIYRKAFLINRKCQSCTVKHWKKDRPALSTHKVCPKCKIEQPRTLEFFGFRKVSNKWDSWCRSCARDENRTRSRKNVALKVQYNRDRLRNPIKLEMARENKIKWRSENRVKVRQLNRLRKLRIRSKGHFTGGEWDSLKTIYRNQCLRCEKFAPEIELQADHVVPLCKNGGIDISNIQPLCGACNRWKHSKIIDYRPKFAEQVA